MRTSSMEAGYTASHSLTLEEFIFDLVVNMGKPLLGASSAIKVVPNLQLQLLDPSLGRPRAG
jgi:hypothetical protein